MYHFTPVQQQDTRCAAFLQKEPYCSFFTKWGLLHEGEWPLYTYRYAWTPSPPHGAAEECGNAPATATGISGLDLECIATAFDATSEKKTATQVLQSSSATQFLQDLFSADRSGCIAPPLTSANLLPQPAAPGASYRVLSCRWTSLERLTSRCIAAGVVRNSAGELRGSGAAEESWTSLPIRQRYETVLPHGEAVGDELRALLLQAHSRVTPISVSSEWVSAGAAALNAECDEEEEEEEEEEDSYGWGIGASKMTRRELRSVFSPEDRSEFLYHILWRLVVGSGPLNQYEDDAAVYFDTARVVYRSLLASLRAVKKPAPLPEIKDAAASSFSTNAVGSSAEDDVATSGSAATALNSIEDTAPSPSPTVSTAATVYEAVVETVVYQVFALSGWVLFPVSDGVVPSNLNYCYVIVNPSSQQVTVWHHHCR